MAGCSIVSSASIFTLFLLFGFSSAKEHLVGGKIDAWKIPSSEANSLNKWAERSRFQVGDHLVWKYDGRKDSVLEVDKEDYGNCSTLNPMKQYNDGITKVELDRPGAFYFISGAKGHCKKGQKLIVVVMSPRGGRWSAGFSPAPSPAPSGEFEGPAVAPSSDATVLKSGLAMALGVVAMSVGCFLM
ncbi:early nodulin-like protein 15 [Arachis stenosperma]|uniref:early nodulin-like protein 15 n=1 Tax=Arachis stenosperma TaxID=217475 RepID=UPI0025AC99E8|nr:early nodulin-like protein 15 [Arachis stenosperma]